MVMVLIFVVVVKILFFMMCFLGWGCGLGGWMGLGKDEGVCVGDFGVV